MSQSMILRYGAKFLLSRTMATRKSKKTSTQTLKKDRNNTSHTSQKKQKKRSSQQKASTQSVSLTPDNTVFFLHSLFHFLYGFLLMSIFFFLVLLFILLVESSFGLTLLYDVFSNLLFIFILASIVLFLVPDIIRMHRINNRAYSLQRDRLVFSIGVLNRRNEHISIDDIERLEIEKESFIDALCDTSTIIIRTRISYYDPIIIPCIHHANTTYIEMEKILSSYKFK